MAYLPETLGLWRLNGSLDDSVSNNDLVLYAEDPYTLGPTIAGLYKTFSRFNLFNNAYENVYGLDFSNNVEYEAHTSYVSGNFTIGFWFYSPDAVGFTRHVITREKTPKTFPIFAKAEKSIISDEEILEYATFVVIEQGYSTTTNRIGLILSDNGVDSTVAIYSSAYTVGLHHCVVTFDGNNSRARIDIDGTMGTWQAAINSVYGSPYNVKINSINPNYVAHQASGRSFILSDLYFKNMGSANEIEANRNVTFGVDYVTSSTLSLVQFTNFAISFTQPDTIATTSILSNGSSIYLGRSNGDILRGDQPIWDIDYNFNSNAKNLALNKSSVGDATYSNDGLVLSSSFIKI